MKKRNKEEKFSLIPPGGELPESNISFSEPVPVLEQMDFWNNTGTCLVDGVWLPPIPFSLFEKSFKANVHQRSARDVFVNCLIVTITPQTVFPLKEIKAFLIDYFSFGNAYAEIITNGMGKVVGIKRLPAMYIYRSEDLEYFYFIENENKIKYPQKKILYFSQMDIKQEIYGLPHFLAALSSVWLNESATLFRRKYYMNGAHAGFILYFNDPAMSNQTEESIANSIKQTRGKGNFNNIFVNSKASQKTDEPKLLNFSDVSAKDEFSNIKNISSQDILAAWRVPLQLMSFVPSNVGGLGSLKDAVNVFQAVEILPIQQQLKELNKQLGFNCFDFVPFSLENEKED